MGVPYSQTNPHFRGGILRIFHVRIGHIFVERWGFLMMMFLQPKQRLHGGYMGMIQVIFWCSERPPIHHRTAGFCTQVIPRCNAMLLRSCLGAVPRFFWERKDEPKTCVLEASCVFFGGNLT